MLSCLRSIKVSQRPFLCPLNVDSGGAEAETEEDFLVKNGGAAVVAKACSRLYAFPRAASASPPGA